MIANIAPVTQLEPVAAICAPDLREWNFTLASLALGLRHANRAPGYRYMATLISTSYCFWFKVVPLGSRHKIRAQHVWPPCNMHVERSTDISLAIHKRFTRADCKHLISVLRSSEVCPSSKLHKSSPSWQRVSDLPTSTKGSRSRMRKL